MITIEYSPLPGIRNSTLQPIIPVTFVNNKKEVPTFALVDSGAAGAVISTVIAEELGIAWRKIPVKGGFGVGGTFRSHEAKVKVQIYEEEFIITIAIIEGLAPYKAILGQKDLFHRAKIIFEGYNKKFHIEFRTLN